MNENPCHTGWMFKLIGVFAGHTDLIVSFVHYENTPIQIYWKFYHQKIENFHWVHTECRAMNLKRLRGCNIIRNAFLWYFLTSSNEHVGILNRDNTAETEGKSIENIGERDCEQSKSEFFYQDPLKLRWDGGRWRKRVCSLANYERSMKNLNETKTLIFILLCAVFPRATFIDFIWSQCKNKKWYTETVNSLAKYSNKLCVCVCFNVFTLWKC